MKRLLLLLIAVTAFSCSSDDAEPVIAQPDLQGTWVEVAIKSNPQEDWFYLDCENFQLKFKYTFNEDGTYIHDSDCNTDFTPINGTYTEQGDILILTSENSGGNFKITVVSENTITKQSFYIENGTTHYGSITMMQKQ